MLLLPPRCMQPLIKAWQESGRLKCSYQPSTEANAIAPAAFYEVDGDAMLALVKELVQGQKVDELLKNADIEAELAAAMKQQQQEDEAAAAAGSPAAGQASSVRSAAAAGSPGTDEAAAGASCTPASSSAAGTPGSARASAAASGWDHDAAVAGEHLAAAASAAAAFADDDYREGDIVHVLGGLGDSYGVIAKATVLEDSEEQLMGAGMFKVMANAGQFSSWRPCIAAAGLARVAWLNCFALTSQQALSPGKRVELALAVTAAKCVLAAMGSSSGITTAKWRSTPNSCFPCPDRLAILSVRARLLLWCQCGLMIQSSTRQLIKPLSGML